MLLETIRTWQLDHMQDAIKAYSHLINAANPDDLNTYRDGGTGWTVVEVLCHLRDFEALFLHRARITVEQEKPDLPFPQPDDLAAEKHYNEQDAQTVLREWQALRTEFLDFLKARAALDWERLAQHPTRGDFSLHDQFFLIARHDMLHLEQAARILAEKQS